MLRREQLDARPQIWIDGPVTVELQGEGRSGGTDATQTGRLVDVTDLGVTLSQGRGGGLYERFYPWSAMRSIRHRPDIAPPPEE